MTSSAVPTEKMVQEESNTEPSGKDGFLHFRAADNLHGAFSLRMLLFSDLYGIII